MSNTRTTGTAIAAVLREAAEPSVPPTSTVVKKQANNIAKPCSGGVIFFKFLDSEAFILGMASTIILQNRKKNN